MCIQRNLKRIGRASTIISTAISTIISTIIRIITMVQNGVDEDEVKVAHHFNDEGSGCIKAITLGGEGQSGETAELRTSHSLLRGRRNEHESRLMTALLNPFMKQILNRNNFHHNLNKAKSNRDE